MPPHGIPAQCIGWLVVTMQMSWLLYAIADLLSHAETNIGVRLPPAATKPLAVSELCESGHMSDKTCDTA